MTAETWRGVVLVMLTLVGCVTLLRVCRHVVHLGDGASSGVTEIIDPDTICWDRCLGPWVSYTRGTDGQDRCVCEKHR